MYKTIETKYAISEMNKPQSYCGEIFGGMPLLLHAKCRYLVLGEGCTWLLGGVNGLGYRLKTK